MTNLEKITSRKRTFLQYQDTEITGVDYGYEDDDLLKLYDDCGDDESSSSPPIEPPSRRERLPTHKTNTKDQSIQPTAFNFTTSLASIAGSLEKNKEHLDAQKQNDSARRLITLQQFLQTPIQRPKYQAFAIPKYDYSNAQWPGGRPLDKEIIHIEGRYDELADIARKRRTTVEISNSEGFKAFGFGLPSREDEARALLNTHAFAMKYKFQPIAAAVWTAFLENTEKDKQKQAFSFPGKF